MYRNCASFFSDFRLYINYSLNSLLYNRRYLTGMRRHRASFSEHFTTATRQPNLLAELSLRRSAAKCWYSSDCFQRPFSRCWLPISQL